MSVEVSICGAFPTDRLTTVRNRLAGFVEYGDAMRLEEYVYGREPAAEDAASSRSHRRVRVKNARGPSTASSWTIQVEQPAEARRTAPRALQFGVTEFAVESGHDPRQLASALGYQYPLSSIRKTGWLFRRGAVHVFVYQLSEPSGRPLDPQSFVIDCWTRYSVGGRGEGKSETPGGGTASQDQREVALLQLEEIAAHLKGLVDLARVD